MRKHIFNAGPSVLPKEVLAEAAAAVSELKGTGQSILEVSHRGKEFTPLIAEAKELVKELYNLNDDYDVLFLQGGASLQFAMLPMNFLNENDKAAYVDTGTWSSKAIKEAKLFGEVNVVASSKEKGYNFIPKNFTLGNEKYLHITSNNTIYGTQYNEYPQVNVPLFVDMSSDIFSKEIDAAKFDLIYAGAQKNLGPAGVTLVILKKQLLKEISRKLPSMLDYRIHSENESLYNTPNVFGIYVCLLTLRWIKKQGGLREIEKRNNAKAEKIYNAIDSNEIFQGHSVKEDRSKMNVTFTLKDPSRDEDFLKTCAKENIIGIKGHRSVGGFRASIYNALPMESVDVLCGVMEKFKV